MAVWTDMLSDMLADIIIGVASDISFDVLADINVNVSAGVITALEFATPVPLLEFSFWAVFDCRPLTLLKCDHVLQAWMPSSHV